MKIKSSSLSISLGAAFLMATSAIGPGFITQTTVFTQKLMAAMAFVILTSVVIDIIVQLNIWLILTGQRQRGSELANTVWPGSGHLLSALIILGGLAFNIGNISGAGLGLSMVLPISVKAGAVLSACIAIGLFVWRHALRAMDGFVKWLGLLMIGMMVYVVWSAAPPLQPVVTEAFWPHRVDMGAIVTLVGGTVGGYICFAGAHRLLDAQNEQELEPTRVRRSAIAGILITAVMRMLLFLAVLGVLYKGVALSADNPAGSVFQAALGATGLRVFGLIFWCASITSVVGSAYTSISFFKTLHPALQRQGTVAVVVFICLSTLVFLLKGKPVPLLIAAGAVNGFILPFALALMLLAIRRRRAGHPQWLIITGWLIVAIMLYMSIVTAATDLPKLLA